jgi:ribonucleotide reductase beta subunit family protein with ferritin-like domain
MVMNSDRGLVQNGSFLRFWLLYDFDTDKWKNNDKSPYIEGVLPQIQNITINCATNELTYILLLNLAICRIRESIARFNKYIQMKRCTYIKDEQIFKILKASPASWMAKFAWASASELKFLTKETEGYF